MWPGMCRFGNKVTSRCLGSDTNLLGGLLLLLSLLLFDARSREYDSRPSAGTSVHMQGHTWSELEVNQQPYPHRYCQVGRRASYRTQTSWPVDLHGLSEACRSC